MKVSIKDAPKPKKHERRRPYFDRLQPGQPFIFKDSPEQILICGDETYTDLKTGVFNQFFGHDEDREVQVLEHDPIVFRIKKE